MTGVLVDRQGLSHDLELLLLRSASCSWPPSTSLSTWGKHPSFRVNLDLFDSARPSPKTAAHGSPLATEVEEKLSAKSQARVRPQSETPKRRTAPS